jgi:hypothetical protein
MLTLAFLQHTVWRQQGGLPHGVFGPDLLGSGIVTVSTATLTRRLPPLGLLAAVKKLEFIDALVGLIVCSRQATVSVLYADTLGWAKCANE